MSTEHTDDATFTQELRRLPYDKRWNLLKPKLESLFYTDEVEQISRILKQRWGFEATPRQCKYRFKSWGWKKSIPEKVKQVICDKALKRAAKGKESIATYYGQTVLPQRLQRSLNATAPIFTEAQTSTALMFALPADQYEVLGGYVPFGNSLLLNWRMPYGSKPIDPMDLLHVWSHGSPASSTCTPANVEMRTPAATDGGSPNWAALLQNEASLMSVVSLKRKRMLLEGRLHDLLRTLSQKEQMTLSTWLYQFWYRSFVAAQTWTRSASRLLDEPLDLDDTSTTNDSASNPHERLSFSLTHFEKSEPSMPSQKCRWSIHVDSDADFDCVDDYLGTEHHEQPSRLDDQSFPLHLHESLQKNDFSDIPETRLPVPIPEVARQTTRSPSELALESVALAIMARNLDLINQTINKLKLQNIDIAPIYPFHIAAAYLDGGTTCCLVFDILCRRVHGEAATKAGMTNAYGHTVLDALLLTILRSHTTINMKDADSTLGEGATFPGQEVDICGRWSADTPCFRAFVASGSMIIPASWKHKFCHTSIQAVLHSTMLLLNRFPTMLDMPSGLFKHRCFDCGQNLQLGPLHALVMIAFCLASAGRPEEDLFGVTAYYLALVTAGMSLLDLCPVSSPHLLGTSLGIACTHEWMTPYEMAVAIGAEVVQSSLPKGVRTGWTIFTMTMRITEEANADTDSHIDMDGHSDIDGQSPTDGTTQNIPFPEDCYEYDCVHLHSGEKPWFGESPILGHVWAAIQAELANHRKVKETDCWLSESFSMEALLESLTRGDGPNIAYVKQSVLKPYCKCGNFSYSMVGIFLRDQVFQEHSSNLDGSAETWARSSFLALPDSLRM